MTRTGPGLFVAAMAVAACGGGSAGSPGSSGPASAGPRASSVETFFPLEDGRIYHYVTNENGETGMLVARVRRPDATRGELRLSNATKRFVLGPDGVAYDTGAFILKAPLELGARWPGEHGGTTRVSAVDASVKVPAGTYAGCVQTTEEGGRPPSSRYVTTYCPGVGMVLLEVAVPGGEARAELKSYGAPVVIEK